MKLKRRIVLSPDMVEQLKNENLLLIKGGVRSLRGDTNIVCNTCGYNNCSCPKQS